MSVVRRGPTAPLAAVLSVLAFPALSQPAATAASQGAFTGPITIKDVKVQFFFEKSATFSENIADFPAPIVNAQRGEGAPEPASGVREVRRHRRAARRLRRPFPALGVDDRRGKVGDTRRRSRSRRNWTCAR